MKTDPKAFGQGVKKQDYEQSELMMSGHAACPGCGAAMTMRMALKALGPDTVVVIPACCWSIIAGLFPYTSLKVPMMHTAFESGGAAISGVRAALDIRGDKKTQVVGFAGDGGTFDIGLQSMSAAAERNENVIYVCYDNEAYMNTGIQRSGATPKYAWTTTTPEEHPKDVTKKNIDHIMAAHDVPYVATATPAYPHDLMAKFEKAKGIEGFRFIHVLASCTPGWRIDSEKSVETMRKAVRSGMFPLIEIEGGNRYTINVEPDGMPLREYLSEQGRFMHLNDDQIAELQAAVDERWKRIRLQVERK
jgi:pyruvate ferredoxin oxidoreductase beta subunit/2-oxoisovalerate ferredoxin oxidoreductase beta subunit